ncbi:MULTISPECIES: glycosyltransferase family 2 protein [unclassified Acidocella]|uniref:glycosyltransferase n=1 Tax=unclassified Acidocella TaxID=2648610 RepID=UPI000586F340|nr:MULTISPECIES: glycosyltransferase family 2 protein [unclassified Acidocella]WBO58755.1 glycosyltransferase family 2 protein [Acidocella sp. MX-AZ03]
MPLALTVVVPCYNERANVAPMVAALDQALHGLDWEVVFVDDDSPDGTSAEAKRLAQGDGRVRCIRRIGRRGLSSAVIEGALSSAADYVAVIDGDMQHDETRLPLMLDAVRAGADMAVGSRHVEGGDSAGLSSPLRVKLSETGIRIAQAVTRTSISDPMSGFFLLRRELFEALAARLTGQGFKILLDLILASPRVLNIAEIPYKFRPRLAGESKLDVLVLAQFAGLLLDKALRGTVPLRFISFALVGIVGVLVNLVVAQIAAAAGADFGTAQTIGTIIAMVVNFQLNNQLTYRAQRLKRAKAWRGLALFMLVCGLGAIANIGIAKALYAENGHSLFSGAAGAAVGVVWNYAVSATLVWRVR